MPMPKLRLLLLLIALALGGCASTHHNPKDPFESFNRTMYQFNDALDKAVVKPVAQTYSAVLPSPVRTGTTNFFSNLDDVRVTLNDVLQFKFVQALTDLERVLFNSTFGLFGLIDVATSMGLEKHDEDFGQTLGRWGFESGPYLVLPFFGSSSVRDGIGLYVDTQASMLKKVDHIPTRNELYATTVVNTRANLLDEEKILEEASIDRYAFVRNAYLQHRRSKVYDGNPPREKFEDDDNGNGKTPDKSSQGDTGERRLSSSDEAAPLPAPRAATDVEAPEVKQKTGVVRIWLAERKGMF